MATTGDYRIKVIDKMFRIIDTLEKAEQPLGVNEIARQTELNTVTAFRILKTMSEAGWAYQNQEEKYAAGYRLCSFYRMDKFYLLLKDIAYCVMRRLTDQEGEVLNLCVRQNETGVLLQQTRTSRFADYVVQVGSALPLYATACGKILISEMAPELLQKLTGIIKFHSYTDKTIIDLGVLTDNLQEIRRLGYATDIGESLQNTCCVAVPVRGPSDEIIAALSFSGLTCSLSEEKRTHYSGRLHHAAQEITRQMFQMYQGELPRND